MEINAEHMVQDCVDQIKQKIENLTTLNIIVAGKTGVGKSTLINSVFRENLAKTGRGKPVTTHMKRYTKKNFPLVVYDTRGFELGKDVQEEVKEEVMTAINMGLASKDINQAIHCIWYCINSASNRVEPEEIEWIRELSKANSVAQVPIIIILTQSFSKKYAQAMRNVLLDENLDVIQVIPVLAQDYEIDEDYVAKAYGLDVLIKVMNEALPEELLDTLHNLQIASLEEKIKRAQLAVVTGAGAAVAAGASPIPISDCAVLIPIQVTMISSIAVIFAVDLSKTALMGFVTTVLGTGGATLLGKAVVSNLLKLIPGAGTVAGGAISGGTAGVLTTALGETFIIIMTQIFKGEMSASDLETKAGRKKVKEIFKEQLSFRR